MKRPDYDDTFTSNGITEPKRNRAIPARVDDAGLDTIMRAMVLDLAMGGTIGANDPELYGRALVNICGAWMKQKSEGLREAR